MRTDPVTFEREDAQALREALRTVFDEDIVDRVHSIMQSEGLGWEGPRVYEYTLAIRILALVLDQLDEELSRPRARKGVLR